MLDIAQYALTSDTIIRRNNVKRFGKGSKTLILAHGFGCNQNMWRFISPYLEDHYQILLFDYVGCGNSDFTAYEAQRYQVLEGYALDIIEICDALALRDTVFVGHSISSTIGWIVAKQRPDLIESLVAICPSPCFLNSSNYQGGFEKESLTALLELMEQDYIGWGNYLAPVIMGHSLESIHNPPTQRDIILHELLNSFCSTDVTYSRPFAEATFLSDYRFILPDVTQPCLILQSANDDLVAVSVGEYTQKQMPNALLRIIDGNGHCLHMTHPSEVMREILEFID